MIFFFFFCFSLLPSHRYCFCPVTGATCEFEGRAQAPACSCCSCCCCFSSWATSWSGIGDGAHSGLGPKKELGRAAKRQTMGGDGDATVAESRDLRRGDGRKGEGRGDGLCRRPIPPNMHFCKNLKFDKDSRRRRRMSKHVGESSLSCCFLAANQQHSSETDRPPPTGCACRRCAGGAKNAQTPQRGSRDQQETRPGFVRASGKMHCLPQVPGT